MPSSSLCRSSQNRSVLSRLFCIPLTASQPSSWQSPHSACPCCRDNSGNSPCRSLHLFPRSPWNQPDILSQPAPPSIASSSSLQDSFKCIMARPLGATPIDLTHSRRLTSGNTGPRPKQLPCDKQPVPV